MKAIVFAETGGPEVLTLADVPQPAARPGSALIRNHAIGVNFADTRFRQGLYTVKPKLPDIPGMEVAGVVEAVGEGVTDVRPGMRVAAFTSRAYAEYCVSPASMVIPLPDSVSFVDGAALLIQVLTAYHLLHTVDSTGPGRSVSSIRLRAASALPPSSSPGPPALVSSEPSRATPSSVWRKRPAPTRSSTT